MTKFNMNDCIHIKLTDYGRDLIIKNYGYPYFKTCVESNKTDQGYYRLQLWKVMSYFGERLYNGCKLPFEMTIYFEKDELESDVKLGHWEPAVKICRTECYEQYRHTCSACGMSYYDMYMTGYPFCPKCGAKMDGERK